MSTAFCFIGFPGAGKTTAMEEMADIMAGNTLAISTGRIVRRLAADHFECDVGDLTGEQIGTFSTEQRENDSPLYVAREVKRMLEDDDLWPRNTLLIEGVRDSEALRYYESFIDNFVVVWVHAPFEERLQRLALRGREVDEQEYTAGDLMHREQRELEWGMDELPNHTDHVIMNTGGLGELRYQLNRVQFDEANQ